METNILDLCTPEMLPLWDTKLFSKFVWNQQKMIEYDSTGYNKELSLV